MEFSEVDLQRSESRQIEVDFEVYPEKGYDWPRKNRLRRIIFPLAHLSFPRAATGGKAASKIAAAAINLGKTSTSILPLPH